MNVTYNRDTYHSYMVIEAEKAGEEYELFMLEQIKDHPLLPFHIQILEDKTFYYYDITGLGELETEIHQSPIDRGSIEQITDTLMDIFRIVDEYLLSADSLLLDVDCLYMDLDRGQLCCAYVPGYNRSIQTQLCQLASVLLEYTDHRNQDNVLASYHLYRVVHQEPFVISALNEIIRSEVRGMEYADSIQTSVQQKLVEEVEEEVSEQDISKSKRRISWWMTGVIMSGIAAAGWHLNGFDYLGYRLHCPLDARLAAVFVCIAGWVMSFMGHRIYSVIMQIAEERKKDDIDIWENMQTTGNVSEGEMQIHMPDQTILLTDVPYMIWLKSMEPERIRDICLKSFPCIIGSNAAEADTLVASPGVSKKHAKVELKNKVYYLSDLNSTNGTWINGIRIMNGEKIIIDDGDILAFADTSFVVSTAKEMNH